MADKTYGKIRLDDSKIWIIDTEPHVVIRLKALFPRISRAYRSTLSLKHAPDVATDLAWFLQRYPHEMDPKDLNFLCVEDVAYQDHVKALEEFHRPEYVPKQYALAHSLRHYQAVAVDLLLHSGRLLLADDVGLGKSACGIAPCAMPERLPALIVCQAHLPRQWRDEVLKFLPKANVHILKKSTPYALPVNADVIISTYHKLPGWADNLARVCKTVTFDECQELRIPTSQKYRAAKHLSECIPVRLGLSATPIGNYGGEMYWVMEILNPGGLSAPEEFQREWCLPWGRHVRLRDPDAFGSYLISNSLMLRRKRKDVGRELPPVTKIVHTVEHRPEVLEMIASSATELAHRILQGTFIERGQAAREFDNALRQATGVAKAPYVAQFVKMLVDEGDQVLLAGWHRAVYDIWLEHLQEFKPVLYTGSETPAQKDESFRRFASGESRVMIISNRSGSGLNGLESVCKVLVHGELDWSPSVHEQLLGRLNRDGMDLNSHVTAFYLLSDAGADPMMAEIVGLKRVESFQVLNPGEDMTKLSDLQVEGERIKRLAEHYLASRKN